NIVRTSPHSSTLHDAVPITVNPNPVAHAGPDQQVCLGQCVTLGGNPTASISPPSPLTIRWRPATGLDDSTIANPKACPTGTTTYIVVVTSQHGCTGRETVVV